MIKGYLCGHRCGSRLTALTASLLFAIQLAVPTFAESPGTASETLDLESGAVATLYAGGLSRFEVQDRRVAIVERQGRLNLRVRAAHFSKSGQLMNSRMSMRFACVPAPRTYLRTGHKKLLPRSLLRNKPIRQRRSP